MSEGGLLQKITQAAESLTSNMISNKLLNRTLERNYETSLSNLPLQKSNLNYTWVNLFLSDMSLPQKLYYSNLIDKKIGDSSVDQRNAESLEEYLRVQMNECPKLFLHQFKEIIQLLLKQTLVTSSIEEFI